MTFYYVILEKHSYTREDTQLHTLISYVLLILYIHYVMCVLPLTFFCDMLHWHCFCDAGNGVAVSVNDIIIKLVATTLKVSTVHRLFIHHVSILEQYTNHSTCMHMYMCIYLCT